MQRGGRPPLHRLALERVLGWDFERVVISHGELIELRLDGLPEPGRFLKAECPRNGTIVEGVPPTIDTVLAAQAWRVGLEPHEFAYPTYRT